MSDIKYHSGRSWLPACPALASVFVIGACGGADKKADEPGSIDPHEKINSMMSQIAALESQQSETWSIESAPDSGDSDGVSGQVKSAAQPDYSPQALSARVDRPAPRQSSEPANMCFARDLTRVRRCDDVCSLASNICDNAGNICRLAGELDGDDWARERCDQASSSCARADQRCCKCA